MTPDGQGTTEERLAFSEEKYRRLFEAAQDGILLIDPITEKIIDANPFLLEMIGYGLQEVVGKELWEIGFFRDYEATKEVIKQLQADKTVRYEDLPLKGKDGREKDVEFVSNLYAVGSLFMIQCNIRDITDRKLVERQAKIYQDGLERLNTFTTNRELKMIELKQEIDKLKEQLLLK